MKKLILLLPALCLSGQVPAKVSYEDAIESNRPYHDANGAVHIPPDDHGLGPDELPDSSQNGDLGHWVKVSSTTTDVVNAGAYSALLSPDSAGQACYKGTKGLILATARVPVVTLSRGGTARAMDQKPSPIMVTKPNVSNVTKRLGRSSLFHMILT